MPFGLGVSGLCQFRVQEKLEVGTTTGSVSLCIGAKFVRLAVAQAFLS
jgi:hypothetical protein